MNLNVPYCAQNDNDPWVDGAAGNTQCMVTSTTMLCLSLIPDFAQRSKTNGFDEPESYLKSKYYKYSTDRGDHDAMSRCLEHEFGIVSQWRTNLSFNDLKASIDVSVPMVVGFDYKSSGHIEIAVGYDDKFAYMNDPYGVREGTANVYGIINPGWGDEDGKSDPYSWRSMQYIWLCGGGGWGRVVLSVNGKATGLK
jgi:hypothetical protein